MNHPIALHYAEKLVAWIGPHVERVEIAGSIRRRRGVCNDVDIVCIPRLLQTRDLFGEPTGSKNLLYLFLTDYVANSGGKARFQSGGELPGKMVILQLPKCQLDLWFATPETFATRLMCRTGSREHNIWLASRAKRLGLKWNPYEGIFSGGVWRADVYEGGSLQRFGSEKELYATLGLPFIEPISRELPLLVKQFGE